MSARIVHSWVLIASFLLFACPVYAQRLTGKVVGISDADTIRVLIEGPKGKREVKVRLHGIDCPEAHQAYGTKAKQFTSAFCFGKVATVRVRDTDRYGRLVAEVFIEQKSLNEALVKGGLAWAYREYSLAYVKPETEARQAKRGLWSDPNPAAPWAFRRGQPSINAAENPTRPIRSDSSPASNTSRLATPSGQEATVFLTRTGTKYHRAGCRYLSHSQISTSLSKAQERFTPCSTSRPQPLKP